MTLHDPYSVILITIGVIMSLPWLARVSRLAGRMLVFYFYPVTTITLEVEDEKGHVSVQKVKLSNSSELAKAILKARHIVKDER